MRPDPVDYRPEYIVPNWMLITLILSWVLLAFAGFAVMIYKDKYDYCAEIAYATNQQPNVDVQTSDQQESESLEIVNWPLVHDGRTAAKPYTTHTLTSQNIKDLVEEVCVKGVLYYSGSLRGGNVFTPAFNPTTGFTLCTPKKAEED